MVSLDLQAQLFSIPARFQIGAIRHPVTDVPENLVPSLRSIGGYARMVVYREPS